MNLNTTRRYSRSSTVLRSLARLALEVASNDITTVKQYKLAKTFYADLLEDGILNKQHPLFDIGFAIKEKLRLARPALGDRSLETKCPEM